MGEGGRGHRESGRRQRWRGGGGAWGGGFLPPVDDQRLIVPVLPRTVHVHVGVHPVRGSANAAARERSTSRERTQAVGVDGMRRGERDEVLIRDAKLATVAQGLLRTSRETWSELRALLLVLVLLVEGQGTW